MNVAHFVVFINNYVNFIVNYYFNNTSNYIVIQHKYNKVRKRYSSINLRIEVNSNRDIAPYIILREINKCSSIHC